MKTILACAISLIAGIVLGTLIPGAGHPQESAPLTASKSSRSAGPEAAARGRDSNTRSPGRGGGSPSATNPPEPLQDAGMVTVPRELIELLSRAAGNRSAGQPLFSQDGKLEEALQIVDREKAELQTAWHASRRKIRDLEAETSTAEDLEDGSVRITVPNLADRMEGLRKGFSSSVRNILGNNRGEVFLSMKQADQLFTPPEGDRTYTVSPEPVGDGSWRFRMTLESANGRRVWVGGNIPDEILHLTAAAHIIPRLDEDTGEDSEDE